MNQELEKLKFVLDFKLNDLKKQIEPQQDDIIKKEEKIQQVWKNRLRSVCSAEYIVIVPFVTPILSNCFSILSSFKVKKLNETIKNQQ